MYIPHPHLLRRVASKGVLQATNFRRGKIYDGLAQCLPNGNVTVRCFLLDLRFIICLK